MPEIELRLYLHFPPPEETVLCTVQRYHVLEQSLSNSLWGLYNYYLAIEATPKDMKMKTKSVSFSEMLPETVLPVF